MERRLKNKVDDKREGKSDLHHFVTKSKYALIIKKKKKIKRGLRIDDYTDDSFTMAYLFPFGFPFFEPFYSYGALLPIDTRNDSRMNAT